MNRNALLILVTAFLLGACGQEDDQAQPAEEPMSEETGMMEEPAEPAASGTEAETSAAPEEAGGEDSGFQADADKDGVLDYEIKIIKHPD